MNSKPYWHYRDHLPEILGSGVIRPATLHVQAGVRPAVWFSLREPYEPTAFPALYERGSRRMITTIDELFSASSCGEIGRLRVDPVVLTHDWYGYAKTSGVSSGGIRRLERSAMEKGGNIFDWRISYEPVPRERWVRVETFNGTNWEGVKGITMDMPRME